MNAKVAAAIMAFVTLASAADMPNVNGRTFNGAKIIARDDVVTVTETVTKCEPIVSSISFSTPVSTETASVPEVTVTPTVSTPVSTVSMSTIKTESVPSSSVKTSSFSSATTSKESGKTSAPASTTTMAPTPSGGAVKDEAATGAFIGAVIMAVLNFV